MGRQKGLQRYLRIYLAKLKRTAQAESREENSAINTTVDWLLSACKYPRTSSFAGHRNPASRQDGHGRDASATLADVDRFLFDNFNSLYDVHDEENEESSTSNALLETVGASASSTSSSSFMAPPTPLPVEQSVAIVIYSKNPYGDFRRSLQEMVDSRHGGGEDKDSLDWDFMEELLISYLELNDRGIHKHILRAFTDVAVSFRRRRKQTPKPLDSTRPADGNPHCVTCK